MPVQPFGSLANFLIKSLALNATKFYSLLVLWVDLVPGSDASIWAFNVGVSARGGCLVSRSST